MGGIFGGSGLNDYGIGDFLGTRDRGNRMSQERRLLELILQLTEFPDIQKWLPGFGLSGPSDTERPAEGGFFGLSNNPIGDLLGLGPSGGGGGGGSLNIFQRSGGGSGGPDLRTAMTLEAMLEPTVFSRKGKKKKPATGGNSAP